MNSTKASGVRNQALHRHRLQYRQGSDLSASRHIRSHPDRSLTVRVRRVPRYRSLRDRELLRRLLRIHQLPLPLSTGVSNILGCQSLFIFQSILCGSGCIDACRELLNSCYCCCGIIVLRLAVDDCCQSFIAVSFYECVDHVHCIIIRLGCFFISTGSDGEQMPTITEYAIVCPVGSPGTDGSYGYIIYDEHNHCEDRQCRPFCWSRFYRSYRKSLTSGLPSWCNTL